jgi:hypothetical protein
MLQKLRSDQPETKNRTDAAPTRSQLIDWYAEGEERVVEVANIQIVVRFVARKGRRGRIAITAPAGAAFCSPD